MKVKIVNKSGQPLPSYATELSAGMDLRASLDAPVTLGPLERALRIRKRGYLRIQQRQARTLQEKALRIRFPAELP